MTLYAKCPKTGVEIETGTQCDAEGLRGMSSTRVAVWCEKCCQHHVMRVCELYCHAEEPIAA